MKDDLELIKKPSQVLYKAYEIVATNQLDKEVVRATNRAIHGEVEELLKLYKVPIEVIPEVTCIIIDKLKDPLSNQKRKEQIRTLAEHLHIIGC